MAGTVTNYEEVQSNEIEVLKSIFIEDFEEEKVKAGPWNKKADRAFAISLRALSHPTDDFRVLLSVKLPRVYPKTLPQLSLSFAHDVPAKARKSIGSLAQAKAKELLGQESIFEIATSIQEALDDVVASAARAEDLPALDEERARKAVEAEKKARQMQEEEEQRQKDAHDEESRHLTEMLERERARLSRLSVRPTTTAKASENQQNVITFDRDIRHRTPDGSLHVVRSVRRKSTFRVGPVTKVLLACQAEASDECLPCFALKYLAVKGSSDATKRRVQALETTFDNLLCLPSHPALLQPLAFRVERSPPAEDGTSGWEVYTLSNFMARASLNDLLETTGTLSVEQARTWIVQILEGLDHLHRNRIAHGRLSTNNILLERSVEGGITLKLADFSFQQELHSLQGASTKFSTAPSAFWSCPESANDSEPQASSPRDIWDLGLVILQLFFGLDVQRKFNSPAALSDANPLSASFGDLVRRTFAASSKKRPTAFELLPHEFLRSDDLVFDETLSSSTTSHITALQSPAKPVRPRRESANFPNVGTSRYASDFVELGRLGKGGFGEVVKARNKIDSSYYAIKKITQASSSALSSVLSEVMVLSRLNSPYVVRYITAWLQADDGQTRTEDVDSSDDSETSEMPSIMPFSAAGGLDFISSGGYEGIEFGYSDDEAHSQAVDDDESTDESTESRQSNVVKANGNRAAASQARRRSSANRGTPAMNTLYIQMEYCQQTLRDLINGGISQQPDEIWRLLHHILQGLAHIHERGLIHRDIKPENIFIDESKTAKIGDLGLATPGQISTKASVKGFVAPELTASAGTSTYIAPEVHSRGGGSYNDKADMYSLGVVVFEMFYPMRSAMERARTLEALRRDPCHFPEVFDEPERKLQKDIMTSLLRHQASQRPSSVDLLRSGKLPSQVEDEAVEKATKLLRNRTSPFFAKLLSSLFGSAGDAKEAVRDYTYDLDVNVRTRASDLLIQGYVKEQITSIFRRHGAIETPRSQLLPAAPSLEPEAARLLDSTGLMVQLPHDLRHPYARMLAKRPELATCRKSFSFGQVFRKNAAGGHPFMHASVDFDMVSNDGLDVALREAELIKVLDEVLESVPSLRSASIYLQTSHSKLLDTILGFVAAEREHFQPIKQILSKLHTSMPQWTWTKIKMELRAVGVASTTIDDLTQFDFRLPFPEAISKLRGILTDSPDLEATYRHLLALETYLKRFKVVLPVFIYPLASLNEGLYRGGMLFQALLDSPKRKTVLCAGGRYDVLVAELHRGSKGASAHALGFSLAWEILIESVIRWHQKGPSKKLSKKSEEQGGSLGKIGRCDVLIDSADPALLRSNGIQLVQELWENDISAELVIDSGVLEGTSHQYQDEVSSHDWLVLIKKDDYVKVRSTANNDETELRLNELLGWLRSEIKERDRAEARVTKSKHPHQGSRYESSGGHEPDIAVFVGQNKSKKTNRRNIVDDAQARTQEAAEAFKNCAIKAVEMKDELFEGLRGTRLGDPDSWKRYIQSAAVSERSYLLELQQMLLEAAKGKSEAVWVYNFRSKSCLLYLLD